MQLKAENISFRYNKKHPWILKDVNFTIESGQKIGLVAPSGFGKSTLAKILAGYLNPTNGTVFLDNKPLSQKGICPVQLIYQHPEKAINPRWKMNRVLEESGMLDEQILNALGIEKHWLTRYPKELSGGELQRFCVARSLFSDTQFLIADEMSTMLDVITQAQIWNVITKEVVKRNLGLIVVTHNKELAKQVCDSIFDLKENMLIPIKNSQNGGNDF